MKSTKGEADYRAGTPQRKCGICTMFRPPSSCTAVQGVISREALCKYFERKKGHR